MSALHSTLKRRVVDRFKARSRATGIVYEVECVRPELEVKTPFGPQVVVKHPECRIVDTMRPVNWNPVDDSFTVVGSGETLTRI